MGGGWHITFVLFRPDAVGCLYLRDFRYRVGLNDCRADQIVYTNNICNGVSQAYNWMRYEWDKAKAAANLARHGVAFDSVKDFAWDRAEVAADSRKDYKEPRWIAASIIGDRVHVLVYTRRGYAVRVVSLRKANKREIRNYEQVQGKA